MFSWKDGHLTAQLPGAPPRVKPSVFEPVDGGFRVVSGRERGERLRVDGDRLIWAGYVFTRGQEADAELGSRRRPSTRRRPRRSRGSARALPALRVRVGDDQRDRDRRDRHRRDLHRPEREREPAPDQAGEERDRQARRRRRPAPTRKPRSRRRGCELPRRAVTIAPPCSAAFPTSATITTATKNCDRPSCSTKSSSEPTSASDTNAVATVANDERREAAPTAPGVLEARGRRLARLAEVDRDGRGVENEQERCDRERQRGRACGCWGFRSSPESTGSGRA